MLHFSMKWFEARQSWKEKPGAITYIKATPAQSAISILSTVGAFTVAYALDWMNPGLAFSAGYVGNSVAENIATKFTKQ